MKKLFEPTKKLTIAILCVLTMAGSFFACTTKNEIPEEEDCLCYVDCICFCDFVHDESAGIVGKWKLMKSFGPFGACPDFSQHNVVWEFKTNNIWTVSAETEHPFMYPTQGEYPYTVEYHSTNTSILRFFLFPESPDCDSVEPVSFSSEVLYFGSIITDGAIYYFVKIN